MPKSKTPNPAFEYVMNALRKNPKAAYADIVKSAKGKRLSFWPILYGRAQLALGIVKATKKPGRPKGNAAAAPAAATPAAVATPAAAPKKRGRPPGRKNKVAAAPIADTGAGNDIDGLMNNLAAAMADFKRARAALAQVAASAKKALS